MANFLDLTTGLPALWAKIKSKFYTKAEVDALIPEIELSDWDENDSTSAAYIENRTHYTEDPVLTHIFTFQSSETVTYYEYAFSSEESSLLTGLDEGIAYTINFNGNTYIGLLISEGNDYYSAGNRSIWDGTQTDTGEPFVLGFSDSYASISTKEEQTGISLSLSLELSTIHKLDSKYLDGSLITLGFGKHSEIFNWEGRYTYNSYDLTISGEAGATEYSYSTYSILPSYWTYVNSYSFLTIQSYDTYSIDDITINNSGGVITLSKTLDEENAVDNLQIRILELAKFADGLSSHVEGDSTKALGDNSHAEGYGTVAGSGNSHAEGISTNALGNASHAEGYGTVASSLYSHAEGTNTEASGYQSHAEGNFTVASGSSSHAEGHYTTASGEASHAEGKNTAALGGSSHAEGGGYSVSNSYRRIYLTGDAGATTYNITSDIVAWRNLIGFSIYTNNYKIIDQTLSDGKVVSITLNKTLSSSSAISSKAYYLVGGTAALATNSHSEGEFTTATGINSHAEGCINVVSGRNSHAEGSYNYVSGDNSHAEGDSTTASGSSSHAEGYKTTASGSYAHAEGNNTIASGNYAHAEGDNTIASRKSQHVYGSFNIQDTAAPNTINSNGQYIEIVGNGTSNTARSNAYTLDWSGNGWYAGKVSAGTVASPANPTAANDLATKAYVDAATAGVSPNLSGLADTNISNPANGQVLKYDSTSSKWVNSDSNEILYATITGNASDGYSIDKTFTEMKDALNNGKQVIAINSGYYYYCTWTTGSYILLSSQTLFATSSPYIGFRVFTYKNDGTLTYYASSLQNKIANFNISSPSEGQVLSYDATNSQWINTNAVTETRVNELIAAALAQYGDGDTATYGYNDASEVNY